MRRPKTLTVASIDWKIKWVEKLKNQGHCNSDNLTIKIRSKLSRDSARHVLWHEVKHAIWWCYGITPDKKDIEESIVNSMSGPEIEVMRNNPRVSAYIFDD